MQVVRAGPDVDEHERPEVDDGQLVAEHRAFGGFGQVVVHQPEERRGQEEGHGVVAVPPLHQRVLHARVDGVGLEGQLGRGHLAVLEEVDQARGEPEVVEDMQHRHGDDRGDVEPERDIDVALAAVNQGHQEVAAEEHKPDDRDGDVDGPLQLGVFLALRDAQGQRQCGGDDDQLPAPEVELAEQVRIHAALAEPLGAVVDRREDAVARKREDRRVGVQRAQAPEAQERNPKARFRIGQLDRDDHADEKRDDAPDHGGPSELAHDLIVVHERFEPVGVLVVSGPVVGRCLCCFCHGSDL